MQDKSNFPLLAKSDLIKGQDPLIHWNLCGFDYSRLVYQKAGSKNSAPFSSQAHKSGPLQQEWVLKLGNHRKKKKCKCKNQRWTRNKSKGRTHTSSNDSQELLWHKIRTDWIKSYHLRAAELQDIFVTQFLNEFWLGQANLRTLMSLFILSLIILTSLPYNCLPVILPTGSHLLTM